MRCNGQEPELRRRTATDVRWNCHYRITRCVFQASSTHRPIKVIAVGDRWPYGTLRPTLENLLGIAALIAQLAANKSPEVRTAESVQPAFKEDLTGAATSCESRLELVSRGYGGTVTGSLCRVTVEETCAGRHHRVVILAKRGNRSNIGSPLAFAVAAWPMGCRCLRIS